MIPSPLNTSPPPPPGVAHTTLPPPKHWTPDPAHSLTGEPSQTEVSPCHTRNVAREYARASYVHHSYWTSKHVIDCKAVAPLRFPVETPAASLSHGARSSPLLVHLFCTSAVSYRDGVAFTNLVCVLGFGPLVSCARGRVRIPMHGSYCLQGTGVLQL